MRNRETPPHLHTHNYTVRSKYVLITRFCAEVDAPETPSASTVSHCFANAFFFSQLLLTKCFDEKRSNNPVLSERVYTLFCSTDVDDII